MMARLRTLGTPLRRFVAETLGGETASAIGFVIFVWCWFTVLSVPGAQP